MSARTTRRCGSCGRQVRALVVVRTNGAGPDVRTNPRTDEPVRTDKRFRVCSGCAPAARTTPAPVTAIADRATDPRTGTGRRPAPVPAGLQPAGGVA